MQAVYRETDVTLPPRVYRNRPSPIPIKLVREELCDVVYLVDADPAIRADLSLLLVAHDMKVVAFASAADYLGFLGRDAAACVILNIQLPDVSGLPQAEVDGASQEQRIACPYVGDVRGHRPSNVGPDRPNVLPRRWPGGARSGDALKNLRSGAAKAAAPCPERPHGP